MSGVGKPANSTIVIMPHYHDIDLLSVKQIAAHISYCHGPEVGFSWRLRFIYECLIVFVRFTWRRSATDGTESMTTRQNSGLMLALCYSPSLSLQLSVGATGFPKNCPHYEMKLKQNSLKTVLKPFFPVSLRCADSLSSPSYRYIYWLSRKMTD